MLRLFGGLAEQRQQSAHRGQRSEEDGTQSAEPGLYERVVQRDALLPQLIESGHEHQRIVDDHTGHGHHAEC